MVVTADGKGVPMRRPPQDGPRPHHRRTKGEKANKKQMACVGAVYSIGPFVRKADDILDEVLRDKKARARPEPQHKHVWAEMTREVDAKTVNAKEGLFSRLKAELAARNEGHDRPVVCLMDGERALWDMQREHFSGAVGILDLFHVLERLWAVAHCFHAEGTDGAKQHVEERLRDLLQGRVGYVIAGLRRRLNGGKLSGPKRKVIKSAVEYLANNREHMRYDEYLAAGYPIGSGVAEGACRHLVKDRLEQTGMRWTVEGRRRCSTSGRYTSTTSGRTSSNSGPNVNKTGYIDQLRHRGRRVTPKSLRPVRSICSDRRSFAPFSGGCLEIGLGRRLGGPGCPPGDRRSDHQWWMPRDRSGTTTGRAWVSSGRSTKRSAAGAEMSKLGELAPFHPS